MRKVEEQRRPSINLDNKPKKPLICSYALLTWLYFCFNQLISKLTCDTTKEDQPLTTVTTMGGDDFEHSTKIHELLLLITVSG